MWSYPEAPRHEDVSGSGDIAPPFLTSALDGGKRSASQPGRFIPVNRPFVPIIEETGWAPEYIEQLVGHKGKGWWSNWKKAYIPTQKESVFEMSQRSSDWGVEFSPNSTTNTKTGGGGGGGYLNRYSDILRTWRPRGHMMGTANGAAILDAKMKIRWQLVTTVGMLLPSVRLQN
jgi:hypothetical protein